MLYALLSGKPPFVGRSVTAVMDRVRFEAPRPLRLVAPQTPQELDEIIGQLLRKNPDERVATPQLLANLLQAMRHALALQEEAAAKSAAVAGINGGTTVVGDANPPLVQETAGVPKRPPQRRAGTVGDVPGGGVQLPTAVSPQDQAEPGLGETVEYTLEEEAAAADAAERKTHFTPVSERDWRSVMRTASEEAAEPRQRLGIILLAITLLAVVSLIVYSVLPLSADQVYDRIRETSRDSSRRDRCSQYIAEFLERFPDDARAAEIQELRADLQCQYLREELAAKVRTLTDLEQAYLDGMAGRTRANGRRPPSAFRTSSTACRPRCSPPRTGGCSIAPVTCSKKRSEPKRATARIPRPLPANRAAGRLVLLVPEFLFSRADFESRRQTRKSTSVDPVLVLLLVIVIDAQTRVRAGARVRWSCGREPAPYY